MFEFRLDEDIFDVVKNDFTKLLGRFYSKEDQEKYGFVAIEFEVI